MPGIAGIVDLQGRFDLAEKIEVMLSRMKHEPWYLVDRFGQGPVAVGRATLGIIDPHPQPVFNHDGSLCLTMYGEVYSYPEAFSQPQQGNGRLPPKNHALSLLKLIEERGIEAVQHVNGSFALALWDCRANSLTLANDRFGLRPLYYWWQGRLLVFASEMKAILGLAEVKREVDLEGLAQFLTLCAILEDRTLFAGIKTLPPASILAFREGRLMRRSYWTLNLDCKAEAVDKKGTLDRAHFLLKQAVKRQMDDDLPKVLSLSGGLDSRTILGAASQLGFELDTFTFGTPGCPDQELARASADCVGMENRFLEISPAFLITCAEHGVWLTEGMDSCTNFHGIEFAPEIRKRASVVLNGFMGGELFGFLSFTAARLLLAGHSKGWIERLFTSMRYPFSQSELKVLLTERFYSKTKDYPFESFASLVGSAPSDSPFDKFYYFRFRELAPKSFLYGLLLDNDQMEYRVPFADYDLVDFVSRLPAKEKALASFHRRLLAEKFPPLGRIPYQRTGLPASSGTTRLLLRKTKDKIVKLAPKTRTYTNYGKWMRHEVKDFVIGTLLNDRSLGRGYFNPERVRGLVERDMRARDRWAAQVGCLLTLELWSQLFMD